MKEIDNIIYQYIHGVDKEDAKALTKAIEQYVIKARKELFEYCVHDNNCLCSQWRHGKPTDDGDYLSQFGYGNNSKWYSRNKKEKPICSCGLSAQLKKGEG